MGELEHSVVGVLELEAGVAMRFIFYAVLDVIRAIFEPQRIIRWARMGATVLATIVVVLLASFVSIAMGLI
jgi:hypothetical protein